MRPNIVCMVLRLVKHALVSTVLFTASLAAQATRSMEDPLFAIRYDPQTIRFELLPASLLTRCKDLEGRYQGGWVYGYTRTANAE